MSNESGSGENVTYEIAEHVGIIRTSKSGWTRELNLVSWNGGEAKYDIRDWASNHGKMSKGLTFTEKEAMELAGLINGHANAEKEEKKAEA